MSSYIRPDHPLCSLWDRRLSLELDPTFLWDHRVYRIVLLAYIRDQSSFVCRHVLTFVGEFGCVSRSHVKSMRALLARPATARLPFACCGLLLSRIE